MEAREILVEYHKTAKEEMLLRLKWRDNWLKYQFILHTIFCSFALGINIKGFGLEISGAQIDTLMFIIPLSIITSAAYSVEDYRIASLSTYLKSITLAEYKLRSLEKVQSLNYLINNWEGDAIFKMLKDKDKTGFIKSLMIIGRTRIMLIYMAFLLIPLF